MSDPGPGGRSLPGRSDRMMEDNPMTRTQTYAAIEVALKSLAVHAANVRARSAEACSETSVQALAANIREVGLLQPLLVQETKRGQYGVLAGSRRLAALNLLAADKKAKGFGPRMKVTCHLVPENAPVTAALSLSENEMQAPMDAIDRYEAFAVLRDADGLDVADIARLFGLAERAVRETLRIGLIAADIRAAHRAGDISLETLKAFARHPDPAVQSGVFTALASEGFRVEEWSVRRALEDHGVRQGDALGAFVLETYRKAGGAIAPDLIEEDSVLSDPGLVQTVLAAKLGDLAEEARARRGMGWAEHRIDPDREAFSAYGCIYPQPADPDETAQARLDALTAKHDEVADAYDAADDRDAQSRPGDECEAVSAEIDALTHAYDPGEAANAGVIAIWQHGGLRLLTGMVRPEDRADAVKKTDATSDDAGPKISARLASDMAIERTRAVGLALAQDPATARVYGDWLLVGNVAKGLGLATAQSSLRFQEATHAPGLIHECGTPEAIEAAHGAVERLLGAHESALPMGWAGEAVSEETAFDRFAALDPAERDQLVAWAVSRTLEPVPGDRVTSSARATVEVAVLPDIRSVWTPGARLLGRLTKPDLLRILRDDLGLGQKADVLTRAKKSEIVEKITALFAAPDATLSEEQREAIARWCPPGMATAVPEADDAASGEAGMRPLASAQAA